MKRRQFLSLAGGGVIVAAVASATGYALTRTPTKALAPWSLAGSSLYDEPRRRALSYAILAPNPHNRQPWLIDLATEGEATIYADPTRLLPHTDPFSRQITIGLGCFLALLRMAAQADGWETTVTPFPEGEDASGLDGRPIARVVFSRSSGLAADPLFAHVLSRRSSKEPYDLTRSVDPGDLDAILTAASVPGVRAQGALDPEPVADLRALTRQAMKIEMDTPRTMKESADLFRIGKRAIEANPDGLYFGGVMFEALGAAGVMTAEASLDPQSTASREGARQMDAIFASAMGFVWLTTSSSGRLAQLAAGEAWLRANLAATGAGVAIHPLSQALQEFPEMAELYDTLHARLAPDGSRLQMLGRVGHVRAPGPSPRWRLETRIIPA